MLEKGRFVPRHILAAAIKFGKRMADPQGAEGAVKIVHEMWIGKLVDGKWVYVKKTLEIIYRESDQTILHFMFN